VADQKEKCEKLLTTFTEAQLPEYQDHIKEIVSTASTASKDASKSKNDWMNDRDYIKIALERKFCPSAVARGAATTVQASLVDPERARHSAHILYIAIFCRGLRRKVAGNRGTASKAR